GVGLALHRVDGDVDAETRLPLLLEVLRRRLAGRARRVLVVEALKLGVGHALALGLREKLLGGVAVVLLCVRWLVAALALRDEVGGRSPDAVADVLAVRDAVDRLGKGQPEVG